MKKSVGSRAVVYPTPICVVGSYDEEGRPNAMVVAWAGLCCSKPPCFAVALRAVTYTYAAITARRAFTVSVPSVDYIKEVDSLGLVSGRNKNKFEMTGLTPARGEYVDAPFIQEFPLVLECELRHVLELGLHTQFIGEIMDVKADEASVDDRGKIRVEDVRPIAYCPDVNRYYSLGEELGQSFNVGRELI